jgi:hypothetical protein
MSTQPTNPAGGASSPGFFESLAKNPPTVSGLLLAVVLVVAVVPITFLILGKGWAGRRWWCWASACSSPSSSLSVSIR